MKKVIIVLVLAMGSSLAFNQTTWTGYLVDKMCSKCIAADAAKAANHTKECLTEDHCASSGYGVAIEGGKWYKFNKKGDELAAALLASTTRDKGMKVTIKGTMKKGKINVTNISESD